MQEAELHMPSAAVRSTITTDSILVEMPAEFDVAGDAGSIGRFVTQPNALHGAMGAMQMDIKGAPSDCCVYCQTHY